MKNLIQSTFKLAPLVALVFSLTLSSCKKGDTGPAGATGTNGKDGNANVKNSSIFINANEWVYTVGECKVTKLVPEITADIVNKGAVMVYMEGESNGSWEALPTTNASGGLVTTFGYTIESGKLHLLVTFDAAVTLPAGTLPSANYKVVLIAGSARAANPNVDYTNYNEVSSTFKIVN